MVTLNTNVGSLRAGLAQNEARRGQSLRHISGRLKAQTLQAAPLACSGCDDGSVSRGHGPVLQRMLDALPQTTDHIIQPPQPKQASAADASFDPATSYACFPVRAWQLRPTQFGSSQHGAESSSALCPNTFVPPTPQAEVASELVRHCSDADQKRLAAQMPIDWFDSPEMDALDPEALLAQAAVNGHVHALSRHFNADVRCSRPSGLVRGCSKILAALSIDVAFRRYIMSNASTLEQEYMHQAALTQTFVHMQGSFSWQPCSVEGYDPTSDCYAITWCNNGKHKQVKRLNLLLHGESRSFFRARLQVAQQRRAECAAAARLREFVAAQPLRCNGLDSAAVRTMVARRLGVKIGALKKSSVFLKGVQEVVADHVFAMKAAALEQEARTRQGQMRLAAAQVRCGCCQYCSARVHAIALSYACERIAK